jgi:hypothetical protein
VERFEATVTVVVTQTNAEKDSPSHSNKTTMSDENPSVRIPEDEEGVHEIAEGREEDGVTEEQKAALAQLQARLIGDID